MKRFLSLLIACSAILVASAGAQSLADVAKQTRAKQKANPNAKVIDNDVLPSTMDTSSETPAASTSPASTLTAAKKDETGNSQPAAKELSKAESEKAAGDQEDQKNIDLWKKQINDEKREISQLERELNVAQREAGLHAAVYYADAGTMLRDSAKFAEDNRKLQAEIDTKTQALAAAKQKLADLQEEARKAGVPGNQLD